jgi:positive regulator of sigma E activity
MLYERIEFIRKVILYIIKIIFAMVIWLLMTALTPFSKIWFVRTIYKMMFGIVAWLIASMFDEKIDETVSREYYAWVNRVVDN